MAIAEKELRSQTSLPPPLPGLNPKEFMQFCADEKHLELVRGEVIQLAPAGGKHSRSGGKLFTLLDDFVEEHDLGFVFNSDAGFILERDPFTVRSPDVAFISKSRMKEEEIPEGFIHGAPDLAIEILSPTDSLRATERKAQMFLRAGAMMVLILNPKDTTLRVYRKGEDAQVLNAEEEFDGEPILPGFRIPVWQLFGAKRIEAKSSENNNL